MRAAAAQNRRRASRWFWGLVLLAIVAMSVLYRAISAPAGPRTALAVLVSALVLVGAVVQAGRVRAALEGFRAPAVTTGSATIAPELEPNGCKGRR